MNMILDDATNDQGVAFRVTSPATGQTVWSGVMSTAGEVHAAVERARAGSRIWAATPLETRVELVQHFGRIAAESRDEIAATLMNETGKPPWESNAEASLIAAKVNAAIDAMRQRTSDSTRELTQGVGRVWYRPLGVMAVLGPFNLPAHLPNGHIVPALLAGNSVVFKPSEFTPGTGDVLASLWRRAGLPDGVLNVVHGDRRVGQALIDGDIDGVLFTGSHIGGRAIHRSLAGRPGVLLALEMGGNNPIVVHDVADLDAAAHVVVMSAFVTAGQRCTCARRLIVIDGEATDSLVQKILTLRDRLRIGPPDAQPEPFAGPVISDLAAGRILDAQAALIDRGAVPLRRCETLAGNPALLSPGILDVTDVPGRDDDEIFGPLLQIIRVRDFDAALDEAAATSFGLAASLLSDQRRHFDRFAASIRAGVVNWNQPTSGASGLLPFGGWGESGNHRPSGFHASDYCAMPIAGIETPQLTAPTQPIPGLKTDAPA